ncbi:MAG TPA: hypothetical protein ENJ09_05705, partial [Planctomycetes bacterium]|nr:hypothetical protein [Planctomycetota bacterium]
MMTDSLGETLCQAGLVTEDQLREARAHQRGRGIEIGAALIELGHLDETDLARVVAKRSGMPFVDLTRGRVPDAVLEHVPEELAVEQGLVPVQAKDGKLVVAVDDPLKRIVADQLSFTLGLDVRCALAAPGALRAAIRRYYGTDDETSVARTMGTEADADDAPIVRLVTRMFKDALALRASDIHIEPMGSGVRVRYRIDGVLRVMAEHP